MKNVIGLIALSFFASVASASTHLVPEYYSAEFKITKIAPMCPRNLPGGAVCMGLGSIVHVAANIGCADSELLTSFDVVGTDIIAVSVVKRPAEAHSIRCVAPTIIRKTVLVPALGSVELQNAEIGK